MAREIDLLSYWMPVLRQLKEFKEIAKAETPELKYILEQIERTLNNMLSLIHILTLPTTPYV